MSNEKLFEKYKIHFSSEDEDIFNASRLLILFDVLNKSAKYKSVGIERIPYYDFFSANPFLIFNSDKSKVELRLEGFPSRTISYSSSNHRFISRVEKLKYCISYLISRDLINIDYNDGRILYIITQKGIDIAATIKTFYSNSYRKSSIMVIKLLEPMSNTKLFKESKKWLKADTFVLDLIDM
jgi:hypothetical protein